MKWKILNISIPVKDLVRSKSFYEMLLGRENINKKEIDLIFGQDKNCFFGFQGFGVRLFTPKPDLLLKGKLQSRRSFITILVDEIDPVINNLKQNDYPFLCKKSKELTSVLVQEPSLNLVQFVKNISLFDQEIDVSNMGLNWGIHHMNIESLDVRQSVEFFNNIAGMSEGKWVAPKNKGDFSINPNKLSIFPVSSDHKGLHIIEPDEGFAFRNNFIHNPSIGGHPAFTVKDLHKTIQLLEKKKVLFSDAKVYAMPGFHQIYLYDINSNILEINQAV